MSTRSESQPLLSVETHLDLIRESIRRLCCRRRLSPDDAEDFFSYSMLRLLENEQRILRSFEGRSSRRTYILVVLQRLLLDWQTARWGRWRPSAQACRLGPAAIALERLVVRDRWRVGEAVTLLRADPRVRLSEADLERVAGMLSFVPRRLLVGEDAARDIAAGPWDGAGAERAMRGQEVARISRALDEALGSLPAEDRVLMRLRYEEGLTVQRIALRLGHDPKVLYRRFVRIGASVRRFLKQRGIVWAAIRESFDWPEVEIRTSLRNVQEASTEIARSRCMAWARPPKGKRTRAWHPSTIADVVAR